MPCFLPFEYNRFNISFSLFFNKLLFIRWGIYCNVCIVSHISNRIFKFVSYFPSDVVQVIGKLSCNFCKFFVTWFSFINSAIFSFPLILIGMNNTSRNVFEWRSILLIITHITWSNIAVRVFHLRFDYRSESLGLHFDYNFRFLLHFILLYSINSLCQHTCLMTCWIPQQYYTATNVYNLWHRCHRLWNTFHQTINVKTNFHCSNNYFNAQLINSNSISILQCNLLGIK